MVQPSSYMAVSIVDLQDEIKCQSTEEGALKNLQQLKTRTTLSGNYITFKKKLCICDVCHEN